MARPPPAQPPPPCELCLSPALVLCPSDDAFLCWRCDSMVHSANFLVARHHRAYLCSCCACPTRIIASGAFLQHSSELCVHCYVPTEDCCSSGSGISDSECSALTSECDGESMPTTGSCRSQSFMGFSTNRHKQPLEFELQMPDESLDVSQDSDVSDGVEDEFSSSERFGTLSPISNVGNDTLRNTGSHDMQEHSYCRSSKA